MFATDDKHPSDLLEGGHIDYIVKRAIALGADPIAAVKAASHYAARYFLMNNKGAIAPGYLADFVVIDSFENFHVELVAKRGRVCYDGEMRPFAPPEIDPGLAARALDTFHLARLTAEDLADGRPRGVIGLVPGEIVSEDRGRAAAIDTARDILKIAVIERHKNTRHIGIGYLQGYGLKSGAIATSVAHDSHNLVVVGDNDKDMELAVETLAHCGGGLTFVQAGQVKATLPLPIAGLVSPQPLEKVYEFLSNLYAQVRQAGCPFDHPFMALAFMTLPVIPHLKLSDRGLVDVDRFQIVGSPILGPA